MLFAPSIVIPGRSDGSDIDVVDKHTYLTTKGHFVQC